MADRPSEKHEEKHEERREERHEDPPVSMTQAQVRELVTRQVKEQLAAMAVHVEKEKAAEATRKADERQAQAELTATHDPYPEIPEITWVFNRSRRKVEVVWNMRSIEIPPLTVMPLSHAVARQSLATSAYRTRGTTRAVAVIVLKGDVHWMKPLSDEEQASADATDPITHATREGQVLGPPELVEC